MNASTTGQPEGNVDPLTQRSSEGESQVSGSEMTQMRTPEYLDPIPDFSTIRVSSHAFFSNRNTSFGGGPVSSGRCSSSGDPEDSHANEVSATSSHSFPALDVQDINELVGETHDDAPVFHK